MDKVVILARGLGTRMRRKANGVKLTGKQREVAETGVKALIPIERPFLDYVLSALADAGYRRVCLVIGPEHGDLRDYYTKTLKPKRLEIGFAVQADPRGTADAVVAARDFVSGDPFLTINSDNYYPLEALKALRDLDGPGLAGFDRDIMLAKSNIPSQRLSQFAVVDMDGCGYLKGIVEKPEPEVLKNWPGPITLSMNCWRFHSEIFPACRAISPSFRGELEIPDAVQYAISQLNQRFRVLPTRAAVLDLSYREDIAPVTERLSGSEVHL